MNIDAPPRRAPASPPEPRAEALEAGFDPDASGPAPLATLSPSRAADFKVCPQLFRFRAIDRIEVPPTEHQARGTTAHLALQRLFDAPPEQRTPERLYDLFRTAWAELKPEQFPNLFESTGQERAWGIAGLAMLRNYFQVEDPQSFTPVERELDMLEELGDITIRGILDRMDDTDEGLVITDYKTGKAPPERYALPAFFALKIYALLVRHRTGRTPSAIRLMYLNGPTVYQMPVESSQLDAMQRQLEALWAAINRAIERDHFPPRTSRLCGWCPYQDRCPAHAGTPGGAGTPGEPAPRRPAAP